MPVGTSPATSTGILPAPAEHQGKTLTDTQIATWAAQGGFTGEDRVIAVAVALAESGGRYAAVSPPNFNGTHDYGAWQINSVHKQLFQQYPQWWSVSNANMAKAVHASQGWKAWTAYNSGAYLMFMPRARTAVGAAPDAAVPENSGQPGTTTEIMDFANVFRAGFQPLVAASQWIGNADNWVRVAQVVLGVALVVGGITIVARPAVAAVAGPAAAVLTKGKAGK